MKKIFFLIITVFVFFSLPLFFKSDVFAKKLLPYLRTATTTAKTTTASRGVTTSVRFRGDRLAIIATFSNLGIANKADYFLSYNTRGTTQGASGSVNSTQGDPATREIIFGSCSKGVCRFDSGITNAKFVVTSYLPSGKKVVKSFKLKV